MLRNGTLLEKNVEKIFKLAGFQTKRNVIMDGYEIDVLAELGDIKIIVQCKQYERSYLNVKDIIHQWDSKRKKVRVSKVLVVVYGQMLYPEDRNLARELHVGLWGEKEIDYIEKMVMENPGNSSHLVIEYLNIDCSNKNFVQIKKKPIMNYNLRVYLIYAAITLVVLSAYPMIGIIVGIIGIFIVKKIINNNNQKSIKD